MNYIWIIATLVAFFIKGLCGFANSLIFSTIMGFSTNNINISPVELVIGIPSNAIMAVKNRKKLKPEVIVPLSLMIVAGSIPGALLLKNVDGHYIKIAFGIVVALLGIEMLFREKTNKKLKGSKILLVVVGITNGILCGIFGIGALIAAYMGRVADEMDEFKGNVGAVFFVENLVRIILYAYLGVITLTTLKQSAILLPVMLVGLFLGILSAKMLDEKIVKKMVIILLIISGIALVVLNI